MFRLFPSFAPLASRFPSFLSSFPLISSSLISSSRLLTCPQFPRFATKQAAGKSAKGKGAATKSKGKSVSGAVRVQGVRPSKKITVKLDSSLTYTCTVTMTSNNTFLNIADLAGNSKIVSSAGASGYSGSQKSSFIASASLGQFVASRAVEMGIKYLNIYFKGVSKNRRAVVKALTDAGLIVQTMEDRTPVPYNGCKPKKALRK